MADEVKEQEPELLVQACECGSAHCFSLVIGMIHPVIKPVEGTDELVAMLHLPLYHAQEVVDRIRQLAKDRGVRVR